MGGEAGNTAHRVSSSQDNREAGLAPHYSAHINTFQRVQVYLPDLGRSVAVLISVK